MKKNRLYSSLNPFHKGQKQKRNEATRKGYEKKKMKNDERRLNFENYDVTQQP